MKKEEFIETMKVVCEKEGMIVNSINTYPNRRKQGVILKNSLPVCPVLYLEDFYSEYCNGKTIESIVKKIKNILKASKPKGIMEIFKDIVDFEKVRTKIKGRMTTLKKAKEAEGLLFVECMNLAATFYLDYGEYCINILEQHLIIWQVTKENIIDAAKENEIKNLRVEPMETFEIKVGIKTAEKLPKFIALCKENMYSSISLFYPEEAFGKIADKLGDIVIVPFSTEFIICFPIGSLNVNNCFELEIMKEILFENEKVNPDLSLGNDFYIYKKEDRKLEIL